MNKFAAWMKDNDKTQRGVAQKLGISTSSLHDIIRKGQLPSLKIAYEIEKYTKGAITMYDWFDHPGSVNQMIPPKKSAARTKAMIK